MNTEDTTSVNQYILYILLVVTKEAEGSCCWQPSLVMTCGLYADKAVSEPIITYSQLELRNMLFTEIKVSFAPMHNHFMELNMSSERCRPFYYNNYIAGHGWGMICVWIGMFWQGGTFLFDSGKNCLVYSSLNESMVLGTYCMISDYCGKCFVQTVKGARA